MKIYTLIILEFFFLLDGLCCIQCLCKKKKKKKKKKETKDFLLCMENMFECIYGMHD